MLGTVLVACREGGLGVASGLSSSWHPPQLQVEKVLQPATTNIPPMRNRRLCKCKLSDLTGFTKLVGRRLVFCGAHEDGKGRFACR